MLASRGLLYIESVDAPVAKAAPVGNAGLRPLQGDVEASQGHPAFMAARSKLDRTTLAALGADKLAALVLDQAERNPAFRRQVAAALAARKGPEAVGAIVDRRLAGLKRAKSAVPERQDVKDLERDLRSLIAVIVEELGEADPDAAIERLAQFLATADIVFDRVDDSHGDIQDVFHAAGDAIVPLAAKLSEKRRLKLPARLHKLIVEDDHGFLNGCFGKLLPHLPAAAVGAWDEQLAEEARATLPVGDGDWHRRASLSHLLSLRQAVADHRRDCDGFIALELSRVRPDALAIAGRLLKAGRHTEALEWVRKASGGSRPRLSWDEDTDDGADSETPPEVRLELAILEAMGDAKAAQELRWRVFLDTLNSALLREYIVRLPDFEEFAVMDRAFAHALGFTNRTGALCFLVAWPKLDLAARHVRDHAQEWDGREYFLLLPAAEALEGDHPVAATILYRSLLTRILDDGRSPAYGHAARYWERLEELAQRLSSATGISAHVTFAADIRKKHGRKAGFWARVAERN